MTDSAGAVAGKALPLRDDSRGRRLLKILAWLVGIVVVVGILELLGVDVTGWLSDLWDQIKAVPARYIIVGLVFQSGQTFFAGLSYYGILSAAYPGEVSLCADRDGLRGRRRDEQLPAREHRHVRDAADVRRADPELHVGGSIAAYLVQKIFFASPARSSTSTSSSRCRGHSTSTSETSPSIPAGRSDRASEARFLIVLVGRIFWRQVKKLWAQAKQGGVILSHPKRYFEPRLPALVPLVRCKFAVIGIFLAAFAIPVTFESIMWVVGSGSLANVASFTPGAVGVTQATNALALDVCCNVPKNTAIAYSTAQQLITTAWNVIFAIDPRRRSSSAGRAASSSSRAPTSTRSNRSPKGGRSTSGSARSRRRETRRTLRVAERTSPSHRSGSRTRHVRRARDRSPGARRRPAAHRPGATKAHPPPAPNQSRSRRSPSRIWMQCSSPTCTGITSIWVRSACWAGSSR